MKFKMGCLVVTAGVSQKMENDLLFEKFVQECLRRHSNGDWGECGEEDRKTNEYGLNNGDRLMSVYPGEEEKLWIITESDRSVTTVLFPEEY